MPSSAKPEDKPNVNSHEVVNYKNSTLPNVGPEIMQLREEEDNPRRIYYSYSFLKTAKRPEKHKSD
ncbi:hypothetical protein CW304_02955 [Bacillus sp. UFRGS-B20]|nr:hypothetical protein CW304_02955 [Bacillus sp. UFRGS-B20]